MKTICIFEDSECQDFLPLVYNRPVYDLRYGIYSLLEKIILQYHNTEISLLCREYLEKLTSELNPYGVNKL